MAGPVQGKSKAKAKAKCKAKKGEVEDEHMNDAVSSSSASESQSRSSGSGSHKSCRQSKAEVPQAASTPSHSKRENKGAAPTQSPEKEEKEKEGMSEKEGGPLDSPPRGASACAASPKRPRTPLGKTAVRFMLSPKGKKGSPLSKSPNKKGSPLKVQFQPHSKLLHFGNKTEQRQHQ